VRGADGLGPGPRAAAQAALRAADAAQGRDRLTVLAYHRIATVDDGFPYAPELVSASPAAFADQLDWLARNFSPISLDDLLALVLEGRRLPARPLLITFDDGYADNADAALPLLKARGLPAVMFLISSAPGSDLLPWWDEVASLVARAPGPRADVPHLGPTDLAAPASRAAARRRLTEWLKRLAPDERTRELAEIAHALGAEPERPAAPLFFGWERVPELASAGVACQPHTATHPILSALDDHSLMEEVEVSARTLERRTGRASAAFAYPNGEPGDYDERVVQALRTARVRVAFTMRPGPVSLNAVRRDPYEIPRVNVRHDEGLEAFALKVAGLVRPVRRLRALLGRSRG
jgi:peptidoglycan/xylan/chitin deacetylase (PgdA/CDA1 family)